MNINKLYIGEFCTVAVHEFEALSVEAFEVIINRSDYMHHNHISNNDDPFLFFCIDTNHEYFTVDKVDKAKRLIGHPTCDINIKFNGKTLLQTAQTSGFNGAVELLHDKMVMNAYALC